MTAPIPSDRIMHWLQQCKEVSAGCEVRRLPGSRLFCLWQSAQLVTDVEYSGRVHDIRIKGAEIYGTYSDGHTCQTDAPADPASIQQLYNKSILIAKQP
jgi:hypothetical protein